MIKPEDLIGKYATTCCAIDMCKIVDMECAAEVAANLNEQDDEDFDDLPFQIADTFGEAISRWDCGLSEQEKDDLCRKWEIVNEQPAGQE